MRLLYVDELVGTDVDGTSVDRPTAAPAEETRLTAAAAGHWMSWCWCRWS